MSWEILLLPVALPVILVQSVVEAIKEKGAIQQSKNGIHKETCATNFRDMALLIKTLEDFGAIDIQKSKDQIHCLIGRYPLWFYKVDDIYRVEVEYTGDRKLFYQKLAALDVEYKKNVQALTYYNLKQKATARNMVVENEEVLEDNSIVVTLRIND